MKNYVLALLPFLLLISCSDEFSTVGTDDRTATMRSSSFDESDERCDVSFSYTIDEITTIETLTRPFDEYCQVDLMVLESASKTKKQMSVCSSERIISCMTIENLDNRTDERGDNSIARMEFCEGVTTYTTSSGETETLSTEMDKSTFNLMVQNYVQTQEQRDSTVLVMINDAIQSGAQIDQDEHSVIITEDLPSGESVRTVIDKESNVILYTELLDSEGNLITKSIYKYTCVGGYIFPDSIIKIQVKETKVCVDRYIKKSIKKFSNHNILVK